MQALEAREAVPIVAPVISIEPPDDVRAAHRAIDDLSSYAWVVFTSANGVDAFFDRLHSLDADARYVAGTRVAAVGAKTAQRLESYGLRPDLLPAQYVGEEIALSLIDAAQPGDRVLIYRAQEARDVLPQMLADAGLEPSVVAAYRTAFVADPHFADKVQKADVLTFSSASTVHGFAHLLGGNAGAVAIAADKAVACLGPMVSDAAREIGLDVDVEATIFTTDGLIAALEAYFEGRA